MDANCIGLLLLIRAMKENTRSYEKLWVPLGSDDGRGLRESYLGMGPWEWELGVSRNFSKGGRERKCGSAE